MSNENQRGGLGLPALGLAAGGVGGYFATEKIDKVKQWVSEPKYNNYDDLVKEMSDKDAFTRELDGASEEAKAVINQAKADADAKIAAEAKYQADLDAYVKANSVAKQAEDTQAIKDLQKQVADLEAGVKAKEAAASQVVPKKEVKKVLTRSEDLTKQISTTKTSIAAQEKVKGLMEEIAQKEKEIAERRAKFRTVIDIKEKSEVLNERAKGYTEEINKLRNKLKLATNNSEKQQIQKQIKELTCKRNALRASIPLRGELKEAQERLASLQKELANNPKDANRVKHDIEIVTQKIDKIKQHLKDFKGAGYTESLDALIESRARQIAQYPSTQGTRLVADAETAIEKEIKNIAGLSTAQKEQLIARAKTELKDRVNTYDRTLGLEQQLKVAKQEYEAISPTRRKIIEFQPTESRYGDSSKEIKKGAPKYLDTQIAKDKEKLAELEKFEELSKKREEHIRKQWAARKQRNANPTTVKTEIIEEVVDGKKVKTQRTVTANPNLYESFESTLSAEDKELLKKYQKATRKRGTKTVQVADSAAVKAVDPSIAADKAKIQELTEQIAKERAALPKQAAKTPEALTAEFVKANGTKEDAVKKAVKGLGDNAEESLKKIAQPSNLKKWGAVAACAVAGMALFSAFRPKHKEQA